MRQKGNNFVEYALMLGLVVGIGWGLLGSYGNGVPGVFGSAAELLQAGSKSTEQKVYDRHMKWLQDTLKDTEAGFQSFAGFMNGPNRDYFDKRKGPEFTTPNGLIDSDSQSNFVKRSITVRSKMTAGRWSVIRKMESCTMRSPFTVRIRMVGLNWPTSRWGRRLRRMCIGWILMLLRMPLLDSIAAYR